MRPLSRTPLRFESRICQHFYQNGMLDLSKRLSKFGLWIIQNWIREAPLSYPKVYPTLVKTKPNIGFSFWFASKSLSYPTLVQPNPNIGYRLWIARRSLSYQALVQPKPNVGF